MTTTTAPLPARGLRYEVRDRDTDVVLSTHGSASAALLAKSYVLCLPGQGVVAVETVYLADGTIWQDEL